MGASLRKHNFHFGFEDRKEFINELAQKSAAAKKNIYEYTKASQETGPQWRREQILKNRVSSIQWGLKSGDSKSNPNLNQSSKGLMNKTFSNMHQSPGTNAIRQDISTIESSRTAKNLSTNNALNKSVDISAHRRQMKIDQVRDQSLKLLKTGGKRIDVNNAMNKDSVATHIVNQNSDEPKKFEIGQLAASDYLTQQK